jgi:Lar family restriction alleviation protein
MCDRYEIHRRPSVSEQMRECPFCGKHNVGTDYGPMRQWVQLFCHDCGASAASCDSEVLAIAAWNQRPISDRMSGELEIAQKRIVQLEQMLWEDRCE